jgi:hypothetical protein
LEYLQKTNITDTTQSTGIDSGSLVTAGGVGIAKQTHIGGQLHCTSTATSSGTTTGCIRASGGVGVAENINAGGIIKTTSTTTSTDTTTGALQVAGGAGIAGAVNVGGALNATSDISTTSGVYKTAGDLRVLSANGSTDTNNIFIAGNQLVFLAGNQSPEFARFNNTGLVMNGARNITLGTGATAPVAGQLGYNVITTIAGSQTLTAVVAGSTLANFTIANVGVYMIMYNLVLAVSTTTTCGTISAWLGTTVSSFTGEIEGSRNLCSAPINATASNYISAIGNCVYRVTSASTTIYFNAFAENLSGTRPSTQGTLGKITYIRIA